MATRIGRIEVRWGETCRVRIYITDQDGAPLDCTGCTARFAVSKYRDSATKDLEYPNTDGRFSLVNGDGTNDVLQWALNADDTVAVARYMSHWDCRMTLADRTKVVVEGPYVVLGSPTYEAPP
jgi:hypothetical protein